MDQAKWVEEEGKWIVKTKQGDVFNCKFLLMNIGFAAKRFTPGWEGIEKFQGQWIHSSFWPEVEPDLKGKKVALIGMASPIFS